jgi:hypothetical protein
MNKELGIRNQEPGIRAGEDLAGSINMIILVFLERNSGKLVQQTFKLIRLSIFPHCMFPLVKLL